jgi:hypothetical protein
MKMRDWRLRAVETRSVISLSVLALLLSVVLEAVPLKKRLATSVSTERPEADWQRVPLWPMPQMPGQ